jgi:hypothetical protein
VSNLTKFLIFYTCLGSVLAVVFGCLGQVETSQGILTGGVTAGVCIAGFGYAMGEA